MSKAGIQSNRGDGYQELVAFDWALTLLSDDNIDWLEMDSVNLPVDDVVISKHNGNLICCQCKKNQTKHKAWSFGDLKSELTKAIDLLRRCPSAQVIFYSRNNFGDISALREFFRNFSEEAEITDALPATHANIYNSLQQLLVDEQSHLSVFQFIQQISFEVTPGIEKMTVLIKERLKVLTTNYNAAFDALWRKLSGLGMRENLNGPSTASRSRLTKNDILSLFSDNGVLVAPPLDIVATEKALGQLSAIGRSWPRTIASQTIPSSVVSDILSAIDSNEKSILLKGDPGGGKTCVLLSVLESLENRLGQPGQLYPVFIQAREFADIKTLENADQFGFPENWVEMIARLTDHKRVVLLIDSLDVLSISREHRALDYFLRQLDRLISIPNVSIIAACREFDVKYDSRLAARTWSQTIKLQGLQWENDVLPLLMSIGIDPATVASDTQVLLKNPRELALYADLALDDGNLNVLTSEELTSNYLKKRVEDNPKLGTSALIAIENMANTMTETRSLSIAAQKVQIEPGIKRQLLSDMVILESRNNHLTFGHQTLLDALVISHGIRNGKSLTEFIQALAPVPFVRPFIRKYVKLLALGERKEFRKHLRLAFTTSFPFHIHRLIAECFAEMKPEEGDWPLLRHLRTAQPDVFQMLYSKATDPTWLPFWDQHLVPVFEAEGNKDKLVSHAHFITMWKDTQPQLICDFWGRMHTAGIISDDRFSELVTMAVMYLDDQLVEPFVPLIVKAFDLDKPLDLLGRSIARAFKLGLISGSTFWAYIIRYVCDDNLLSHNFDENLRCDLHEFSDDDNFLKERFIESPELLGFAINTLELWSKSINERRGYEEGRLNNYFLHRTSHDDKYNEDDLRGLEHFDILLRVIEIAVVHNAKINSIWWQKNKGHLCASKDAAIKYFAILGFTENPQHSHAEVSSLLTEAELLETGLYFELGTLIQKAFIYQKDTEQDKIQSNIISMYSEYDKEPEVPEWILQNKANLAVSIPCHLRSDAINKIVSERTKAKWPLMREVDNRSQSGMVRAPFGYEVFLTVNVETTLCLLHHYKDYDRDFDDLLIGGRDEVAQVLSDAVCRLPSKFFYLLTERWKDMPDFFKPGLLNGISRYINFVEGDTKPDSNWKSAETMNSTQIFESTFELLERHISYWQKRREFSDAIRSCSYIVENLDDVSRLLALISQSDFAEKSPEKIRDPVNYGLNSSDGRIAESLMLMATRLMKKGLSREQVLDSLLIKYSKLDHAGAKGMILRRLPYFQSLDTEFGWLLFDNVMRKPVPKLWKVAERCLYCSYKEDFDRVNHWLNVLQESGAEEDLETWGRISALASLTGLIDSTQLTTQLSELNSEAAWRGTTAVWTNSSNAKSHRIKCLDFIRFGLQDSNPYAPIVANRVSNLVSRKAENIQIPIDILQRSFNLSVLQESNKRKAFYGIEDWLNSVSLINTEYCPEATEAYLDYAEKTNIHIRNYHDSFTQLLNRLFGVAEEQEECDNGEMLHRVIALQDKLILLGADDVYDWLEAAERP